MNNLQQLKAKHKSDKKALVAYRASAKAERKFHMHLLFCTDPDCKIALDALLHHICPEGQKLRHDSGRAWDKARKCK